jgi:hypothetical protein
MTLSRAGQYLQLLAQRGEEKEAYRILQSFRKSFWSCGLYSSSVKAPLRFLMRSSPFLFFHVNGYRRWRERDNEPSGALGERHVWIVVGKLVMF